MNIRWIALLTAILPCALAGASEEGDGHDLLGNMGTLQYLSHKLDLSIRHQNRALADFYAHEIEETIEATAEIEQYDGKPVGKLTEGMLGSSFERFEQALDEDSGDWETIDRRFGELINACNACHEATEHGFIEVRRTDANPYMQSFEPSDG